MYSVARLNRPVARVTAFCAPFALIVGLAAGTANADITATAQIANAYGSTFTTQTPVLNQGGSNVTQYQGNYTPASSSELGINYTATADQNGFFFLHDNYCVGTCRTGSSTVIDFAVTNNGPTAIDVRFDSLITPGHIAEIYNGGGSASFNFGVSLNNFDGFTTLYSAQGGVNSDGIYLNTGNITFNGQDRQTGTNYDLLDWDTTNLSVDLGTIAAGGTAFVRYAVTYQSSSNDTCTDIFVCGGKQVVFGDPRNAGDVTNLANLLGAEDAPDGRPVIGGAYGKFFVPFAFVDASSPFSFGNPPSHDPLEYGGPLYKSRGMSVPEPATWAMMIGGFGMIGGAVRRRRVRMATC